MARADSGGTVSSIFDLAGIAQLLLGNAGEAGNVVQPPHGPPQLPGYSRPGPPASYAASASTATKYNDPFWNKLPAEYQNQLQDIEHQFQLLGGFNVPISQADMVNLAHSRTVDLFQFGQYMWGKMSADQQANAPWLRFGMDSETFNTGLMALSRSFEQLTGKAPSQDVLTQAFQARFMGPGTSVSLAARDYQTYLQNDANMQKAYPWLKYGQNYREFQQHKAEMKSAFGFDLSDEEASKQLQYYHSASPDFYAASATAPQAKTGQSEQASMSQSVAR